MADAPLESVVRTSDRRVLAVGPALVGVLVGAVVAAALLLPAAVPAQPSEQLSDRELIVTLATLAWTKQLATEAMVLAIEKMTDAGIDENASLTSQLRFAVRPDFRGLTAFHTQALRYLSRLEWELKAESHPLLREWDADRRAVGWWDRLDEAVATLVDERDRKYVLRSVLVTASSILTVEMRDW